MTLFQQFKLLRQLLIVFLDRINGLSDALEKLLVVYGNKALDDIFDNLLARDCLQFSLKVVIDALLLQFLKFASQIFFILHAFLN